MSGITYVKLDEIKPEDLIAMLNKCRVREHLIEHEMFDSSKLLSWLEEKNKVDSTNGCKVRGVLSNNMLAGWCGIQLEEGKYEIAIVLDEVYWGIGKRIFSDIMNWAKQLGHKEVYIHLLHTRPEYNFLRKISRNVFKTEMHGNKFITYQLSVY